MGLGDIAQNFVGQTGDPVLSYLGRADPVLSGMSGGGRGRQPYRSDENLLYDLAIAGYQDQEGGARLFERDYWKLMGKAQRRGLDVGSLQEFGSLEEVVAALPKGASQKRQRVAEQIQFRELEREKSLRNESIGIAQDALDRFLADDSYESLLDNIRNLPETLSDEDVDNLKRMNVQRARDDELARLKRVGATIGLRGMAGGGAFAALAEEASKSADQQISQAFNQINMEKLETERSDLIEGTLLEADVLQRRQQARIQLEENLRNAREGFMSSAQPLQDYSAFLEAIKGRELQADLAREQMRNDLYAAGIQAGGSIVGGGLGAI